MLRYPRERDFLSWMTAGVGGLSSDWASGGALEWLVLEALEWAVEVLENVVVVNLTILENVRRYFFKSYLFYCY